MRSIAVVNQKGGCGKTTTVINLAGFLAAKRRRPLVFDMDPQGHATLGLSRDARPSRTMYDVFIDHRGDRQTRLDARKRSCRSIRASFHCTGSPSCWKPSRCWRGIRHSVKLAEAASHGVPIAEYCNRCAGFDDYAALASEILQMEQSSTADPVQANHRRPGAPAPTLTPEGVVFAVEAPAASRVHLVGDFNGWELEGSEMQPFGRIWTSTVKLPPGSYRYNFVVDGQWQSDPLNAVAEPTPYGGHNSVLILDSSPAE